MPRTELLLKKIYSNIHAIKDELLYSNTIRNFFCFKVIIDNKDIAEFHEVLINSLIIKFGQTNPNASNVAFLIDLKKILNILDYSISLICDLDLKIFFSNIKRCIWGSLVKFYNKDEFY